MSRWFLFAVLLVAGCAPTTEFRVETRTTPLAPGRLLVVPVGEHPRLAGLGRRDSVFVRAGFESEEAHETAFWNTFVDAIEMALPGFEATLGMPMDSTAFAHRRALVQGVQPGFGRERWTIEPVLMPVAVDSAAIADADYVLYVRDVRTTTRIRSNESALGTGLAIGMLTGLATGVSVVPILPTRGVGVGADIVLVSTASGAPVVVLGIAGAAPGEGLLGTEIHQGVWQHAMRQLGVSLAARTGARAR